MSTSDPLQSLREAIQSHTSITYAAASGAPSSSLASATHLVLSPLVSFPKSTPTRYFKPGTSLNTPNKEFYSLEATYLAWLLRDAPGAEYMKQARESGLAVGFVSVTERKGVVDWLNGKGEGEERVMPLSGEFMGSTTPPGTPPSSARQHTLSFTPNKTLNATLNATATSPAKRRYVADPQDSEVVKKIKQSEVELRDRNTVLRGIKPNVSTSFSLSIPSNFF